jgi:hypothetical protein
MRRFLVISTMIVALPSAVMAGPVPISSFGAPSVSQPQFDSLGSGNVTNESSPFTLGIATYSSSSGSIQVWGSGPGGGFADCVGGCVTNGFFPDLSISLNHAYGAVGLYVGQATSYTLDVSFFSASHALLGTEVVSNSSSGGGLSFVGWADGSGVQTVDIVNPTPNSFDVSAASIYTAVPEPSTWALMLSGLGGLGFVGYRQRRKGASRSGT